MSLPTFIIAGAQHSGTTTLHDMLAQHPAIHMSNPKELNFFDRRYDGGLEWYGEQFTPASGEVHAGESTPFYMCNRSARERMMVERRQQATAAVPSGRYPPLSEQTQRALRGRYRAANDRLAHWLGRDLSHWY